MEALIPKVAHGRFVLMPVSEKTRGHSSHTYAALYKDQLAAFLSTLPAVQSSGPNP